MTTPQELAYWLQGFFEITDAKVLTTDQVKIIKDKVGSCFKKVTKSENRNESFYSDLKELWTTDNTNLLFKEPLKHIVAVDKSEQGQVFRVDGKEDVYGKAVDGCPPFDLNWNSGEEIPKFTRNWPWISGEVFKSDINHLSMSAEQLIAQYNPEYSKFQNPFEGTPQCAMDYIPQTC